MSGTARFVIIGADAAGMSAAAEARRVDADLEITAYDRGASPRTASAACRTWSAGWSRTGSG
jgi:NADPH-dependent 2,4-dienoyl-CoA reductase/sulfur reductase-like enzyme